MGTDSEVLFHALYILLTRADDLVIYGVTVASFLAGYTLARIVGHAQRRWEDQDREARYIRERLLNSIAKGGEAEEEQTEEAKPQ